MIDIAHAQTAATSGRSSIRFILHDITFWVSRRKLAHSRVRKTLQVTTPKSKGNDKLITLRITIKIKYMCYYMHKRFGAPI